MDGAAEEIWMGRAVPIASPQHKETAVLALRFTRSIRVNKRALLAISALLLAALFAGLRLMEVAAAPKSDGGIGAAERLAAQRPPD
jgi:hypothetical protein